jgi:peptide-methionine (R)-S-oxide reductase
MGQSNTREDMTFGDHQSLPPPQVSKSEQEWKSQLTPEEFYVCRKQGTESPFFKGSLNFNKSLGVYLCKCCDNILFNSKEKFDSGEIQ